MYKVCVTGHRPDKIGSSREWVLKSLNDIVDKLKPNICYTGMALGVDQDFAQICFEKGIPYIAAIPFEGQELKWKEEDQFRYCDLIHKATSFTTVCNPGYEAWKMQRRNQWMVDEIGQEGTVIAVWDGTPSGTANCVNYATKVGRHIVRINPKFKTITGL